MLSVLLTGPCALLSVCLCGIPLVQAFSRFYFVGDEDLLEIVGNANEPAKVAQHLGKMFASVGALNMVPGQQHHNLRHSTAVDQRL